MHTDGAAQVIIYRGYEFTCQEDFIFPKLDTKDYSLLIHEINRALDDEESPMLLKGINVRKIEIISHNQAIADYLDSVIRYWREVKKGKGGEIATYYIDAFQSARVSLLGETLPVEEEG